MDQALYLTPDEWTVLYYRCKRTHENMDRLIDKLYKEAGNRKKLVKLIEKIDNENKAA